MEPLIDKGARGELDQFSAKEFHPDVSTADLLKKFETNYSAVRVGPSVATLTLESMVVLQNRKNSSANDVMLAIVMQEWKLSLQVFLFLAIETATR